MIAYKVLRIRNGERVSLHTPAPYRILYRQGEFYNGVFAFNGLEYAMAYANAFEGIDVEVWECHVREMKELVWALPTESLAVASYDEFLAAQRKLLTDGHSDALAPPYAAAAPAGTVLCSGLVLSRLIVGERK